MIFGGEMTKCSNDNISAKNSTLEKSDTILDCYRDLKKGNFKAYLSLAEIYENGLSGVKRNFSKAVEMREKYVQEFRKHVPSGFDLIAFVKETGDKYKEQGNKYKAADYYLEASLLIHEMCNCDEELRSELIKEYNLEELLKEVE